MRVFSKRIPISPRYLLNRHEKNICKNYKLYLVIFANMEKYCYLCSRMKKKLSLIMTSLAVIFTLMAVGIHHHHHGEMMCLAQQESCEQHGTHDSHHSSEESSSDHSQHYLASSIVKINVSCHVNDIHHGFSALPLFVCGKVVNCPPLFASYIKMRRHFQDRGFQSWRQVYRGLRAPPCA